MRHLALVCALTAAAGIAAAGQTGKKLFISADMEGISGISASTSCRRPGRVRRSRKMMADDVNAAVGAPGRRRDDHRCQRLAWQHAKPASRGPDPQRA